MYIFHRSIFHQNEWMTVKVIMKYLKMDELSFLSAFTPNMQMHFTLGF